MIDEPAVRAVLNGIIDPCSIRAGVPAGLGEMGLIHSIETTPRADGCTDVAVLLGVTDPTCLMAAVFLAEAHERLSALQGIGNVDIRLDHGVIWTPDRFDPAYARRLADARKAVAR